MKKYLLTMIYAQVDTATGGLSSLKSELGVKSITRSVLYIGGGFLAVGLIGVIWAVATGKPHAKEYVISWIIGVMFYLFLLNIN